MVFQRFSSVAMVFSWFCRGFGWFFGSGFSGRSAFGSRGCSGRFPMVFSRRFAWFSGEFSRRFQSLSLGILVVFYCVKKNYYGPRNERPKQTPNGGSF